MCGIAGIYWQGKNYDQHLLEKTLFTLKHRGPDEGGIYLDNKIGLVHSRLSIIDHSGGKQPFTLGQNKPILIFNGEIFNYQELRKDLEEKGEKFTTDSDTEVLYLLLCRYGKLALKRLNGQYAFAFYEPKNGDILLGRDPFGEKPLYYCNKNGFTFSSEIKAIIQLKNTSPHLCAQAMHSIVSLWAPLPNQSVWKDIFAIPPGHILSYSSGEVTLEKYFSCKLQEGSIEANLENIRHHFSKAVKNRMVSDVPIGLFLSGGLDSSLVGYEVTKQTSQKIKSFSVSFDHKDFDESTHQKTISNFLNTDHISLQISNRDIIDNMEEALYFTETPSPRSAFIPMYLLCKEVHREGIKVVLTGEGADEIFLGYDIFREIMIKQAVKEGASFDDLRPILEKINAFMLQQPGGNKFLALKFSNYKKLAEINTPLSSHNERINMGATARHFLIQKQKKLGWEKYLTDKYYNFSTANELEQGRAIEIESLLSGHLLCTQGDRVSMANSVETRPPFLDRNLVDYVNQIKPSSSFDLQYGEKALLKKAYKGRIPESILSRQKFPYRAPDSLSFANEYGIQFVMDKLSGLESDTFDIKEFRIFCADLLSQEHISPRENHAFMVIFTGILLANQFKKLAANSHKTGCITNNKTTSFGKLFYYN